VLRRVLRALGIRSVPGRELAVVERALTHRTLVMRVIAWAPPRGVLPRRPGRVRWTSPLDLTRLPLSTAMRRAVEISASAQAERP
jgi:hypothetical protein